MIDLHLHTTASDGRSTPAELVATVAAAGVRVMAVTDHDTVAAVTEVAELAGARGMTTLTGIEITAVEEGRDVHVLAYGFRTDEPHLLTFLQAQLAALEMPAHLAFPSPDDESPPGIVELEIPTAEDGR